jgi:hypothetical protein
MKIKIHFCIYLIFLIASCTEKETPADNTNLNSIENSIKGKWLLKSKSDSLFNQNALVNTSSYTSFSGEPYLELLTTRTKGALMGGEKAKDYRDVGSNLGLIELGPPVPVTSENGYWYYDEKSKIFVAGGLNLNVLKSTSKELVLQFKYGEISSISYKITWTYKR